MVVAASGGGLRPDRAVRGTAAAAAAAVAAAADARWAATVAAPCSGAVGNRGAVATSPARRRAGWALAGRSRVGGSRGGVPSWGGTPVGAGDGVPAAIGRGKLSAVEARVAGERQG